MQSTTRAIAYAERIHETTLESDSAYVDIGCGVVRTGGRQVHRSFRIGRQRMTAGSRRATAKRWLRSASW